MFTHISKLKVLTKIMMRVVIVISLIFLNMNAISKATENNIRISGRLDQYCQIEFLAIKKNVNVRILKTHGGDFYVYPPKVSSSFTGCQNVWLGNGFKLTTTHYKNGIVTWIRGQEPKDVRPYFCLYKNKLLFKESSFNIKRCTATIK